MGVKLKIAASDIEQKYSASKDKMIESINTPDGQGNFDKNAIIGNIERHLKVLSDIRGLALVYSDGFMNTLDGINKSNPSVYNSVARDLVQMRDISLKTASGTSDNYLVLSTGSSTEARKVIAEMFMLQLRDARKTLLGDTTKGADRRSREYNDMIGVFKFEKLDNYVEQHLIWSALFYYLFGEPISR
jgi:hypothetical protein